MKLAAKQRSVVRPNGPITPSNIAVESVLQPIVAPMGTAGKVRPIQMISAAVSGPT